MDNDLEPVKLVFLGDSSVGKTSFLLNFTNDQLIEGDSSVVCDFSDNIELDGTRYHVNFWDINGDLEDRLRPLVYPGTSVFMLCFDVSNRTSFENIKDSWTTEIRQYMPDTPSLLIGNKMDLRDQRLVKKAVYSFQKHIDFVYMYSRFLDSFVSVRVGLVGTLFAF